MPRVPAYDGLQVGASTLPQTRLSIPEAPDTGRGMQEFGQSLSRAGGFMSKLALEKAQQAAQVKLNDVMNQAVAEKLRLTYDPEAGYVHLKGEAAITGQDGKPRAQEYQEQYEQFLSKLESGLGNDLQREAFRARSGELKNQFQNGLAAHASREFEVFRQSVQDGTIQIAQEQMRAAWGDKDALAQSVNAIKAAVVEQGRIKGLSAVETEANLLAALSPAHANVIAQAIDAKQFDYAEKYLKDHAGEMQADHLTKARAVLTFQQDSAVAGSAVNAIVGKYASRIAPKDADRAFEITLQSESGGRQFGDDGKPLTSKAGAIGMAQVMPDTAPEAAKLAGLEWDEARYKNDPEYNRMLGRAYFDEMLRQFEGNLPQAWAAYNAGPGRLREGLKQAEKDGKPDNWLSYLPKETQNYVARNLRAFQSGAGAKPPTLLELKQELRAQPGIAGNPQRQKLAEDALQKSHKELVDAYTAQNEKAFADGLRHLEANDGRYSELPASVIAAVPYEKLNELRNAAARIAKGDDVTDLWLYNKMETDPEWVKNLSDDAFYALRTQLSETDFKHFSKERAKLLKNAAGGQGPGDLDSAAVKGSLDMRLLTIGIDPAPNDRGTNAQRVGAIRQFINTSILAAQAEAGKKFTRAEIEQHLDTLFLQSAMKDGWFSDSPTLMMGMQFSDIPSAERERIKEVFKNNGIPNPTHAQVLELYFMGQTTR